MGRSPCCDNGSVKKGLWSPEEDAALKAYLEERGGAAGSWIALPSKIGLKRCGKSCRLRWLNYLRPDIRHGGFSDLEDRIICSLYARIGSRWSIMAAQLPGRTDNDIKNHWHTKLKKKLKLPGKTSRPPLPPPPPRGVLQLPSLEDVSTYSTGAFIPDGHHDVTGVASPTVQHQRGLSVLAPLYAAESSPGPHEQHSEPGRGAGGDEELFDWLEMLS